MESTKPGRRSEQEIFELMEEFEKSGSVTVKEFCEMHDVSNATFYNWQKIYRAKNENANNGFLTLEVAPSRVQESMSLFAEIKVIKLYQQVTASYLKELVQ